VIEYHIGNRKTVGGFPLFDEITKIFQRKEVMLMTFITLSELLQFFLVVIAILALVVNILILTKKK